MKPAAEVITQAIAVAVLAQRNLQSGLYHEAIGRLDRSRELLLQARELADREREEMITR